MLKPIRETCPRSLTAVMLWCWGVFGMVLPIAAEDAQPTAALIAKYCVDCHGQSQAEAEVDLERLAATPASFAGEFKTWRTALRMLEQNHMPPEEAPQPTTEERKRLMAEIQRNLTKAAQKHAGDPGEIPLRRLTSAEYAYTIRDLTGLELKLRDQLAGDAVGGEGFTNVGLVQFLQDSTLEQYLQAAKTVASHAVIGAGPLGFYEAPGQMGLELSAMQRIQTIYREHGFRTAAGEGGEAYGLDRYPEAFFTAWRYRHRNAFERNDATLASLAKAAGIDGRFAEHVWAVLNQQNPTFPTSEIVSRWQKLPEPANGNDDDVRERCREIHRAMLAWQSRFGKNPDAKEEAPLLAAEMFDVTRFQAFDMNINWPEGTTAAHIQMAANLANRDGDFKAVIVWHHPVIQFRMNDGLLTPFKPLKDILSDEAARSLKFGQHPYGEKIAAVDFVMDRSQTPLLTIPVPQGARLARLKVEAELDVQHGEDCIVRCTITQTEDTDQGKSVSGLLANPQHPDYPAWKAGVMAFARQLPQISHREPAPSDRDPIPEPFDNSYNNAERNHFHTRIKYSRDDAFLVEHILDDEMRRQLDLAWIDLLGSADYYDANLQFLAKKYRLDLGKRRIGDLEAAWINHLPKEPKEHAKRWLAEYTAGLRAFRDAEAGHVEDVIRFAQAAWRRPLSEQDQHTLRTYYQSLRQDQRLDHSQAIRGLIVRVLMAPDFLFHLEKPTGTKEIVPLSQWELANRLSYFLWSSIPDAELNRAALAGELKDSENLKHQARRMLQDPKAKRLAEEFFGQWFGFYRFDQYRGIDPKRFPEFNEALKSDLHQEAVMFFEHIIRRNRPVQDILFADYLFLNKDLAAHYGIAAEMPLANELVSVPNAGEFRRGGLFGLGAVLTVTSAPLRTSPVKRGDWVLRRVLGTPVPPPPADAGSIPADDVLGDGLTVRQRLESHRKDASCRNCHSRIDPLGFALERYDPIGRWRDNYRDGQPIETTGTLRDGSAIDGVNGLKNYLTVNRELFHRTLCTKLVGYALGRGESIQDAFLIEQMLADCDDQVRFAALVEKIVASRQFRFQRGPAFQETPTATPKTSPRE